MSVRGFGAWLLVACAAGQLAAAGAAQRVSFADPLGDDFGPGGYVYPTDPAYIAGSFDLVAASLEIAGAEGRVEVRFAAPLEDAWGAGRGFALQMVFVFVDLDHREGSGFTDGVPGLNVKFAPADAWDTFFAQHPSLDEMQRKLIERAKGVLMRRKSFSEEQAYQHIRRLAMSKNQRLAEVARKILDADEVL